MVNRICNAMDSPDTGRKLQGCLLEVVKNTISSMVQVPPYLCRRLYGSRQTQTYLAGQKYTQAHSHAPLFLGISQRRR